MAFPLGRGKKAKGFPSEAMRNQHLAVMHRTKSAPPIETQAGETLAKWLGVEVSALTEGD